MLLPNPLTIDDLSLATLEGTGVFDVLMRANKVHLESEFAKGRIKGPEYSSVYLGSLESVLQNSVAFLLGKDKAYMEARLIEQQIINAAAQLEVIRVEKLKVEAEVLKINAEVILTGAQIRLVEKQIEAADNEKAKIAAETALLVDKLLSEAKQRELIDTQIAKLLVDIQMTTQQIQTEIAQKCKLEAEYDNLMMQKMRIAAETVLIGHKSSTEKAQVTGSGVDEDSVIGRQKALYKNQTDGYLRDAEQKAANILVDTWKVRRTTDDETEADANNALYDPTIKRVVDKLLGGVGA